MNSYSDTNKPKSGTARRLYDALKNAEMVVHDLHYNPNLWGKAKENGWGTWAAELTTNGTHFHCFLGFIGNSNSVYLQMPIAPYTMCYLSRPEEVKYFASLASVKYF